MTTGAKRAAGKGPERCKRKFLRVFPGGFSDQTYIDWERDYKWQAHLRWQQELPQAEFKRLLKAKEFAEISGRAVRIESRTNLLFSFEKMALRDAVKVPAGAKAFAEGLYEVLHSAASPAVRFEDWVKVLGSLPRKQTRVLTWPLATVFLFLAQPEQHFFLKPMVTRRAFQEYGLEFRYVSSPNPATYVHLLESVKKVGRELAAMKPTLKPADLIDVQSFLWVQGSDEYEE